MGLIYCLTLLTLQALGILQIFKVYEVSSANSEQSQTLHNYITRPMAKKHLKSRKLFIDAAQTLLAYNTNAPTWIHDTWKENWSKNIS